MAEDRNAGLLSGLFIGAAIGAGATFLFGTKRGKQLRDKIKKDYPEVFDKFEGLMGEAKDTLSEGYEGVVKQAKVLNSGVQKSEAGRAASKGLNQLGQTVESVGKKMQAVSSVGKAPTKRPTSRK